MKGLGTNEKKIIAVRAVEGGGGVGGREADIPADIPVDSTVVRERRFFSHLWLSGQVVCQSIRMCVSVSLRLSLSLCLCLCRTRRLVCYPTCCCPSCCLVSVAPLHHVSAPLSVSVVSVESASLWSQIPTLWRSGKSGSQWLRGFALW